jgi:hypothetical protein
MPQWVGALQIEQNVLRMWMPVSSPGILPVVRPIGAVPSFISSIPCSPLFVNLAALRPQHAGSILFHSFPESETVLIGNRSSYLSESKLSKSKLSESKLVNLAHYV